MAPRAGKRANGSPKRNQSSKTRVDRPDSGGNNGSAILSVPDALGEAGRARKGAHALLGLQEQLADLDDQQVINGHGDEDGVPRTGGGVLEDLAGNPITYSERRKRLQEAIGRLVAAHEHHRDLLDAEVERIQKQLEASG